MVEWWALCDGLNLAIQLGINQLEIELDAKDFLAKRGCSLAENFVVFDTSPSDDLNVLLEADRNGLYYYRRVANILASWPFCNCFLLFIQVPG